MDTANALTTSKTALQSLNEEPEEVNQQDSNVKVQNEINNTSKFDNLMELVSTSFAEVQSSTQELMELKDDLLMQFLPPTLKFKIAVIFGNMYRSLSDLNTPVNEMIRLVKIYSASWEKNSALLKKINDMYESKKQLLNIAIKRLTLFDKNTNLFQKEKRIMNWEKLYLKLSEAKGHGRRWKFQIETFRKKSNQGYTELLNWVLREPKEQTDEQAENNRKRRDKDRNSKQVRRKEREPPQIQSLDTDRDNFREEDFEAKSKSSFGKTLQNEDRNKNLNEDNYMVDIDSDHDIFSDSSARESRRSRKKSDKPPVETAEKTSQTEPDNENVACWTGEPNYTRYFIIRLFKPQEFSSRKLKFKITYGATTYVSKNFESVKAEKKVKINEQQVKTRKFKSKNSDENEYDEKKIDTSKYEDFIFELNDFIHHSNDLSLNNDDCVQFEMKSEDKETKDAVAAYLNLPMDDVHTLDLPILYYKDTEEAQVVDFYEAPAPVKKSKQESSSWLRLNDMSVETIENYELLSKRTPYTFDMFKNKTVKSGHGVCKLPVMFFWVRKPWIFKLDKNTGTQSLRDIVDNLVQGQVKISVPDIMLAPLPPPEGEVAPGDSEEIQDPSKQQTKPEEVQALPQPSNAPVAKLATKQKEDPKQKTKEEPKSKSKEESMAKSQPAAKSQSPTKLQSQIRSSSQPQTQPQPQPEPEPEPQPQPQPPQLKVQEPAVAKPYSRKSEPNLVVKLTDERGCSPINILPPRPPSTPTRGLRNFDMSDIRQNLSSDEVQSMQETYRLKIDELNLTIYKLENELSQIRSLNDYRSDHSRMGKLSKSRMSISKPNPFMTMQGDVPEKSDFFSKKTLHPNTSVDVKPLPKDFFERLKAFSEKSHNHHRDLMTKYMEEEANIIEQQMAVQHRLDTQSTTAATVSANKYEDFCLPAVFMPFKSANSVFNPRAHQYFHPSGSNEIRLTQPPAIFQLPPLPPKSSISVINLFDLGRRYQAGEPDYYINEYIKKEFKNPKNLSDNSQVEEEEEGEYETKNEKNYLNLNQNN